MSLPVELVNLNYQMGVGWGLEPCEVVVSPLLLSLGKTLPKLFPTTIAYGSLAHPPWRTYSLAQEFIFVADNMYSENAVLP